MDTVFIRGLKAKAVIGVFDWEKQIRQNLVLDLDLRADVAHAAASDTLEDAVDYKAISQRVVEFVEDSQYQLVESLAEAVARIVREEFAVSWVRIRIAKPFAVRTAQEVGVVIERGD
ncbi:MAG: dihydroneopterin aldolase [Gammaproteobacteria bacterium]|nr:dihydroneopterin aldolase [Gammaproteobacteria bacterium]